MVRTAILKSGHNVNIGRVEKRLRMMEIGRRCHEFIHCIFEALQKSFHILHNPSQFLLSNNFTLYSTKIANQ